jgi:hypothetical protein
MSKNGVKISLDCPFKPPGFPDSSDVKSSLKMFCFFLPGRRSCRSRPQRRDHPGCTRGCTRWTSPAISLSLTASVCHCCQVLTKEFRLISNTPNSIFCNLYLGTFFARYGRFSRIFVKTGRQSVCQIISGTGLENLTGTGQQWQAGELCTKFY